jgi:hypothetical protein
MMTHLANILRTIVPGVFALAVTSMLMLAIPQEASATHGRFANIEWTATGNPGEVVFTVRTVWRRNFSTWGNLVTGDPAPNWGTFRFGDGTTRQGNNNGVITDHSITGNWLLVENTWTHTYADPTGTYTAAFNVCCRISSPSMVNRYDLAHKAEARVNPSINSPRSSTPPILGVLAGSPSTFQIFANDPDGGTLRYRFATNFEATNSNLTSALYNNPPNMTIDPNTGEISWNNVGLDAVRFWTTQVIVEKLDANGDVLVHAPIDLLLRITDQLDNLPPIVTTDPASPIQVIIGNILEFDVNASDPNPGDTIELTSVSLPGGATMNPVLPISGPASGVSSTFSWQPNVLGTYFATFVVSDQLNLTSQVTVQIQVVPEPPPCPPPTITETVGRTPGGLGLVTLDLVDPEGIVSADFVDEDGLPFLENFMVQNEGGEMVSMGQIFWTPFDPADPPDMTTFLLTQADAGVRHSAFFIRVENSCGTITLLDPLMEFEAEAPVAFALSENYPNPFNPSTTIRIEMPESATVTVQVFDMLGRLVTTLLQGDLSAGVHEVQWDGRDAAGQVVAGGVYIYRLTSPGVRMSQTMTLLK